MFSQNIVKIHALLKKMLIGNGTPFMNKELRKAIYTRSRFRNRYFKNPTKENETSYIFLRKPVKESWQTRNFGKL